MCQPFFYSSYSPIHGREQSLFVPLREFRSEVRHSVWIYMMVLKKKEVVAGGEELWPSCCWGPVVVCFHNGAGRVLSPVKPFIVWLQLHCLKKSLRWFCLWPSVIFSQLSSSQFFFIASFCFCEANGFSPPRDHHGNKMNIKWTSYMFQNELYTCNNPCTLRWCAVLCVMFVSAQRATRGSGRWVPSAFVSAWAGFPSFLPLLSFYIVLCFPCT